MHQYPMYPYVMQPQEPQKTDLNLLLDAARTGAVVGATGAAAVNLHRARQGEVNWQQGVSDTVKVGFSAGVATAAATAVGQLFARQPALSLLATLATGTAVMYALNDNAQEENDE